MDYVHQHSNTIMCSKHNKPIVEHNQDSKFGPGCVICVQNLSANTSIEQFNQQESAIFYQQSKQMDLDHQQFQQILDELLKYKQNLIISLDKIIQIMMDQIKIILDSKLKLNSIIQSDSNKETKIKQIQIVSQKSKLINKDVRDQIGSQLKSFQLKFADFGQLFSKKMQNEEIGLLDSKIQIQVSQIEKGQQFKDFQYELIEESCVRQNNKCYSFAFNKDNTVLLVGCGKEIIVYNFWKSKILQELQSRLKNPSGYVYCLYFMKKSNSFVSGSSYSEIIIWILDQNEEWVTHQILNDHTSFISCILMNKEEDWLVSGGGDCKLKFWKLMNGNWTCQLNIETNYSVRNMSFNEIEDKLIVYENSYPQDLQKSVIQVLIQNNNKQWCIGQTLNFDGLGWRLGFTIGDQFLFSSQNSDLLEIYDYDKSRQKFQKISQLQIQKVKDCCAFFPCQYIQSLHILAFKHGEYLNIIKVNENYKYELIQQVNFGTFEMYGRMSDDGQYLAAWDASSKEIQINGIQSLE